MLNGRKELIKKHPSYGLIHLVRRDHNAGSTLFGCDVKQHRTIQLEIRKGYKYTDYGLPHYTTESNKPILEIEMSFAQLADLIIIRILILEFHAQLNLLMV